MNGEVTKRLINRCRRWIERLSRFGPETPRNFTEAMSVSLGISPNTKDENDSRLGHPNDQAVDRIFEKPYVIALALEQIFKYTTYLEPQAPGDLKRMIRQYQSSYKKAGLGDLRDLFEHEADYCAEAGLKPELSNRFKSKFPDVGFGFAEDGQNIESISIFGVEFSVLPTTKLALSLYIPLRDYRELLNATATA